MRRIERLSERGMSRIVKQIIRERREFGEQQNAYTIDDLESMKNLYDKDPSEFMNFSKQREEMKTFEQDQGFSDLMNIIKGYLDEHPNDAPRLRKMLNTYTSKFFES